MGVEKKTVSLSGHGNIYVLALARVRTQEVGEAG